MWWPGVDKTVPLYRHPRVRDMLAAVRTLKDTWDNDLAVLRLASLGITGDRRVSAVLLVLAAIWWSRRHPPVAGGPFRRHPVYWLTILAKS